MDRKPRFGDPALPPRFWTKVAPQSDGCWHWMATRTGRNKYGQYVRGNRQKVGAHREAYQALVGEVPDGLVLDHLCRVPHCVNLLHLEPVTQAVNIMRGNTLAAAFAQRTQCANGHPFDDDNTAYVLKRNRRVRRCRTCHNETTRLLKQQQRRASASIRR